MMGATSSASTKLLHGGLRYLEHGQFKLVSEALRERQWWISKAPHLAKPLQITLPVYKRSQRPGWMVWCGLKLYEWLAGDASLGPWRSRTREETLQACPSLRSDGLRGSFTFYDGQMDDSALGLWAVEQASAAGVQMHTDTMVEGITPEATVRVNGVRRSYDRVVNTTGPWARRLLDESGIATRYDLDLIRGSHLLLDRPCDGAFLLESPNDARACFVLPYQGKTLVGSTEVRQQLSEPIDCSPEEARYLQDVYSHYFPLDRAATRSFFSGLRPLIRSHADPSKVTREYAIERAGSVVSVFGGKWTTARTLGLRVAEAVTGRG